MTVKLGISLTDETHRAAVVAAKAEGLPFSTFVDQVLARELFRRGVDDHNAMLRDAGLADLDQLKTKVAERRRAIDEWRTARQPDEDGGVG